MRKEVIFAIVSGAILGLIIAFGIWRANLALSTKSESEEETPTPTVDESTNKIPEEKKSLTIVSPQENEVSTQSSIEIRGTVTEPSSFVVISTADEDKLIKSSRNGEFKNEVILSGELNQIKITNLKINGEKEEKNLLVIYSTSAQKVSPVATGSSTTKSERVAYIGTITDISGNTVEIKNDKGDIKQLSIHKTATSFIKIDKQKKNITFNDIAIGDYVVGIGNINGKEVLEVETILITAPLPSLKFSVVTGTVDKTPKLVGKNGEISIKNQLLLVDRTSLYVLFKEDSPIKTDATKVEKESEIIAIGLTDIKNKNSFTIRTLFMIAREEKPTPTKSP